MQARVSVTGKAAQQKSDTSSVSSLASTTELRNGYMRAHHIVPDTYYGPKNTILAITFLQQRCLIYL